MRIPFGASWFSRNRTGKHRGKGSAIAGSDHTLSSRSSSGGDRMKDLNGASAEQNGKDCRPSRRQTVRLIVRPQRATQLLQSLQLGPFSAIQPLQLLQLGEL